MDKISSKPKDKPLDSSSASGARTYFSAIRLSTARGHRYGRTRKIKGGEMRCPFQRQLRNGQGSESVPTTLAGLGGQRLNSFEDGVNGAAECISELRGDGGKVDGLRGGLGVPEKVGASACDRAEDEERRINAFDLSGILGHI